MKVFKILFITYLLLILLLPLSTVLADDDNGVVILAPSAISIPEGESVNFFDYARGMYNTMLTVAVISAALMITIGGVYYIFSYVPGMKEEGKKTITAAVLGLIIALMSWLILYTINPDLLEFSDRIFMRTNPHEDHFTDFMESWEAGEIDYSEYGGDLNSFLDALEDYDDAGGYIPWLADMDEDDFIDGMGWDREEYDQVMDEWGQ